MGQHISRRLFLKGGLATAAGLAASSIPGTEAAAKPDDGKQLATLLDIRKLSGCEFFFFKQKTAYEISECDWSSDVCSSDLSKMSPDWRASKPTWVRSL